MVNKFEKELETIGVTLTDIQKKQFVSMQSTFDTFVKDMKAYSTFLTQAAEEYKGSEVDGTQKAQEIGKIF